MAGEAATNRDPIGRCDLCGEWTGPGDRYYVWHGQADRRRPRRVHLDCLGPWADREQERRAGIVRD